MNQLDAKKELTLLLAEKETRKKYNQLETYFPDTGKFRRDLYPKQLKFFEAGATYKQRAMIAANRSGKSLAGGLEMAYHATGRYPHWWKGRKFFHPVNCWAIGVSNIQTKEVCQHLLVGDYVDKGSGLIPKEDIDPKCVSRSGVPEAIDTLRVKHHTNGIVDGWSTITFKSYEQERTKFQGQAIHVIWMDEEPKNFGIYTECLTRIATTDGMIYCTFTPLLGLSDVVLSFMPGGRLPADGIVRNPETGKPSRKFIVQINWEEVPHINEEMKDELLSSYSNYEREARAKGIPQLGSGAIYPMVEDRIICEPFVIPPRWRRCYGMDVGPTSVAVVWLAKDPNTKITYVYHVYKASEQRLETLQKAIKAVGAWIPGVVDPAADKLIVPIDGRSLYQYYLEENFELALANNSVEAGIFKVWNLLSSGQLKFMSTCEKLLEEFRLYRRDESGKIVKKDDHLMDALRYGIISGLDFAISEDEYLNEEGDKRSRLARAHDRFRDGADETTGY